MDEIRTASARARLGASEAIHWHRIRTARYLGWRAGERGAGTWWARYFDGQTRKQHYRRLPEAESLTPARQYDAALLEAEQWWRAIDTGVSVERMTVRQATDRYLKEFAAKPGRSAQSIQITQGRADRLIYPDPIAAVELHALRPGHLKDWRDRVMATPAKANRSKAVAVTRERALPTVNRDLSLLRAVLNKALDDGFIVNDLPWRKNLKAIEAVGKRRDVYLSRDERRDLLAAADNSIRPFLRALTLLPLRPGTLARLTVGQFNKRTGTLQIVADKSASHTRDIPLPEPVAAFLAEQARGKLPGAPLVSDPEGRHWIKETWRGPIRQAVAKANIRPDATAYALRHSTITDLCAATRDPLLVAQLSGTSMAMIERHYGHLMRQSSQAALATLVL